MPDVPATTDTETRTVDVPKVGPPPSFDPETVPALEDFLELLPPSLTPDMIPLLRDIATHPSFGTTEESLRRDGAYELENRQIPGPPGDPDVTVLIATPAELEAPAPAIYHVHGGGLISGNRRSHMEQILDLAEPEGMVVVSVEYRLAPEHPHPAPVEDCYAGFLWTVEHAEELGIDPDRIVVGGISAGGNLAAAVSLLARDRGGPPILGQMVVWPMIDNHNNSPSTLQMRGIGVWDQISNETAWDALLGTLSDRDDVSPYAAPSRAEDLSGLPPAYLEVGSVDTLRDETVEYASRIWQAGGDADLHVWGGGYHAFTMLAPDAAMSLAAVDVRRNWVHRLLARRAR
jgi:acetyl esterase/lipase